MKKIKYKLGAFLLVLTLGLTQGWQPLHISAQSNSNNGEYLIDEAIEFGSESTEEIETEEETEEESSQKNSTLEEREQEETSSLEEENLEEDGFIPQWLNLLMDEKSQNNTMLAVAYQDYQQIEDKFDYLDIIELGEGSTYDFVLDNFTYTHENVEIMEETSDIGLSVVSFLYTAEEGELNPERDIEDWAMIEFYFVTDILVYSSLSTMSLGFNEENALPIETVNNWVDQTATVGSLADDSQFELNAFGQVLAGGEFVYSLGMPVFSGADFGGGLLVVNDEQVMAANTVTLEDVEAVGYSAVMYVLLIQMVPNNVFMPAEQDAPADNNLEIEESEVQTVQPETEESQTQANETEQISQDTE